MIRRLAQSLGKPAALQDISSIRSDKWQRLSPISIVYFIVKHTLGTVRGGIQTFAVAPAAILATAGENRWVILAIVAVIAAAALVVGSTISYFKFKFRIEGDKFLIRSGVFKRRRLSLGFDRIQNVALKEPIYFRPFGLVVMALESAGSSAEEVSLGGIPRGTAQSVREHVLAFKRTYSTDSSDGADSAATNAPNEKTLATEASLILAQPVSELVRYGISNNNIWVFAGLIGAFLSQFDQWWESAFVVNAVDTVGATIGTGIAVLSIVIALVGLLMLGVLMLASILGAIIVNYNYRLSYQDGRYHRTRGLIERQETSLPEVKIQNLQIDVPFIAKLLKRAHLTLGQIGFSNKQNGKRQQKFIIPSVTDDFTSTFTGKLYQGSIVLDQPMQPISDLFIFRHFLFSVLPVAIIVAVSWSMIFGLVGIVPLVIALASIPVIALRRKRYGYASDGHVGIIRSGLLGEHRTVFPFFKVQNVKLVQTPGQRRRNLATLKINLAGKTLTLPYMPLADAQAWRDTILYRVQTSNAPWM